jgi:hypothetical protein
MRTKCTSGGHRPGTIAEIFDGRGRGGGVKQLVVDKQACTF